MSYTNISEVSNIREALDFLFHKIQTLTAKNIKQSAITGPNGEEISVEEALLLQKEDSSQPVGMVSTFAVEAPPAGWLKANGAEISRSAYPELFKAIGTIFGGGDGSTTFKLPDLRGEFIRGFDNGRGIDTGRVFGSFQDWAIKSHFHSLLAFKSGTGAAAVYGGLSTGSTGAVYIGSGYIGNNAIATVENGYPGTGFTSVNSANVSSEIRPRNIALLACIKY